MVSPHLSSGNAITEMSATSAWSGTTFSILSGKWFSPANDHFLRPACYPDIAESVHDTKITGMEHPPRRWRLGWWSGRRS